MEDPTRVISTVGTRPATGLLAQAADLVQRVVDFAEVVAPPGFHVIDVQCVLHTAYYVPLSAEPGKVYLHDLDFDLNLRHIAEYEACEEGSADVWHEMAWKIGVSNDEQFYLLNVTVAESHPPHTRYTQGWPTSRHTTKHTKYLPGAGWVESEVLLEDEK